MTELRRDPYSLGRRTTLDMFDVTGVISFLNVLLSKLYSLLSSTAVLIACLYQVFLSVYLICEG